MFIFIFIFFTLFIGFFVFIAHCFLTIRIHRLLNTLKIVETAYASDMALNDVTDSDHCGNRWFMDFAERERKGHFHIYQNKIRIINDDIDILKNLTVIKLFAQFIINVCEYIITKAKSY